MSRTSIAARFRCIFFFIFLIVVASTSTTVFAEESTAPATTTAIATPPPAPPATRQAAIEQQQAAKVETLQPVTLAKGERAINQVEDILTNGLTWRPHSRAPIKAADFRSASATCVMSVRATRSTCAAAIRSAATRARRRSSPRRICSTAAANSRSSAAGAMRRRLASMASVKTAMKRIARTTSSASPMCPRRCA